MPSRGPRVLAACGTPRRAHAIRLVVLVDLLMPPPDGVAFMAEVAADPSLAARHCYVVMTASRAAHLDLSEEMRCLLAAPVLFTPFEAEDLLAAVAEAARRLEGGR
jgi:CheY-like chemotaxis protein